MSSPQYIRPGVLRYVVDEPLTGTIDGSNTTFETLYEMQGGAISVYLNGLKLKEGISDDFTVVDAVTIQMNYAPLVGDTISADYLRKITE